MILKCFVLYLKLLFIGDDSDIYNPAKKKKKTSASSSISTSGSDLPFTMNDLAEVDYTSCDVSILIVTNIWWLIIINECLSKYVFLTIS